MSKKISRKDFLLGSAVGLAAMAIPSVSVSAEEEAASYNATSEEGLTNVDVSSMKALEADGIQTRALFAGNLTKHPAFDSLRATQTGYRVVGPLTETDRIMSIAEDLQARIEEYESFRS